MTDRPAFYDRRAKHGIVNMEKMSDDLASGVEHG